MTCCVLVTDNFLGPMRMGLLVPKKWFFMKCSASSHGSLFHDSAKDFGCKTISWFTHCATMKNFPKNGLWVLLSLFFVVSAANSCLSLGKDDASFVELILL